MKYVVNEKCNKLLCLTDIKFGEVFEAFDGELYIRISADDRIVPEYASDCAVRLDNGAFVYNWDGVRVHRVTQPEITVSII